jgi:hypothetical protein
MGLKWAERVICLHGLIDVVIIMSSIVFMVFTVIDPEMDVVAKVIWCIVMACSVATGIWLFNYWMMIMSS